MSKRDFAIDMMGINYGLDSDEIDALEREYADKGAPLRLFMDYRFAFESHLLNQVGESLRAAKRVLAETQAEIKPEESDDERR